MAGTYEIRNAKDGKCYFVLKAGNGEIIATSERYDTVDSAIKGMNSVKANAMSEIVRVGFSDKKEDKPE